MYTHFRREQPGNRLGLSEAAASTRSTRSRWKFIARLAEKMFVADRSFQFGYLSSDGDSGSETSGGDGTLITEIFPPRSLRRRFDLPRSIRSVNQRLPISSDSHRLAFRPINYSD